MRKKLPALRSILTLCLLFTISSVFAQRTISGKVTNTQNQAVAGASVQVKGTTDATQTNSEGVFAIKIPSGKSILLVTFVGLEPLETPVDDSKTSVNITLRDAVSTLSDVVVTGYTSQVKRDITGSVAVVNVKELTANPGSNIQNLLQGKAAGVTVGTSGIPGAGANVRIHGYSTFTSNEPLYIVDGARVAAITELNPNDIETMQILKDASAASIYGSAAAGGVIIITTKRGKLGRPRITYDTYYGRQEFNKRLDLMNTKEYGDYLFLLAKNSNNIINNEFKHGQYAGPTGVSTTGPIIPDYIYANGSYSGAPGKNGGIAAGDPAADAAKYKLDLFDVNGPEIGRAHV